MVFEDLGENSLMHCMHLNAVFWIFGKEPDHWKQAAKALSGSVLAADRGWLLAYFNFYLTLEAVSRP